MKQKIYHYLSKNSKLKCYARLIKNRNNKQFIERVLEINTNSNLVDLSRKGILNNGRALYYIDFEETGNGFFAEFRKVLNALYFADYFGLVPVVRYSPFFAYAEKELVDGTSNPFEYYYKQPGGISLEDLEKSACVLNFRSENISLAENMKPSGGYTYSEVYESTMADIMKKYIALNEKTDSLLKKDITNILGEKKVLGVHVRGTDFKNEYNRHPKYIGVYEYLESAKKMFYHNSFDNVFLATDDSSAVKLFREEFGDKLLIYTDVVRSSGTQSVMLSNNSERKMHHYLLGYEVLRDMYTLSKCDGLLAGLSQVSICARITKRSMDARYSVIKIMDNGIAYNDKKCIDDINKMRLKKKEEN